jgi:hypothetical protein
MRVYIAAIGRGFRSKQSVERFRTLAQNDVIGRHLLVEDPEEADVVLVVDLHATESDIFPQALRRSSLPRAWRSKVRVWDQRDNGYYTHPGLYVAPAPRLVKERHQKPAPYISTIAPVARATTEPDLLYSFTGTLTYPTRGEIFRLTHSRALVEQTQGINFFAQAADGEEQHREAHERYNDLIARSKFVLCPRGLGPSTFRLYETMSAGRVPVIISDQWVPPEQIPWSTCSVRIPERSICELPTILEANESQWPELVAGVRTVVSNFLAPSVVWNYLMDCLAGVDPGFARRPWWADRRILRQGVTSVRFNRRPGPCCSMAHRPARQ